ncbi:MAG: tryptophan synthase subunit beta [Candidatus Omnitrophica bacterium]|nr:tryptophan synthase subunit beta [Candidatus Omnitrophota bacterium]
MKTQLPDKGGHFGPFGGCYAPETLMGLLLDLEKEFHKIRRDQKFRREFEFYLKEYAGRPTNLYLAKRLSAYLKTLKVYLKREDLLHTGAHKINNTLGQILVARRMGKTRIIAETGAGQHGVATATAAALFGLKCVIYMGSKDVRRQSLNVFRMKLLGAEVIPVESGSRTLKDAMNEAVRDWVTNVRDTFYIIGSVAGFHPYPVMVRTFQSVIGQEARRQFLSKEGRLPNYLVACVGGGSNAMGLFHAFYKDQSVKMIGVEAAGHGLHTHAHAATLMKGQVGVLHGSKSMLLQDKDGQVQMAHSVAAGLDYPGVGPEHAYYQKIGRAQYVAIDDKQAIAGLKLLARTEGIIPALETAHAIAYLEKLARRVRGKASVIVCLSGRGDKDMGQISQLI